MGAAVLPGMDPLLILLLFFFLLLFLRGRQLEMDRIVLLNQASRLRRRLNSSVCQRQPTEDLSPSPT